MRLNSSPIISGKTLTDFKLRAGLANLGRTLAIFQAVVESVLKPVAECCRNYVDDVVIYSHSWSEHLVHLGRVIECLGASGLSIKLKKCCFGRKHLLYLGHKIGAGLLAVPEHRVAALASFARPRTKKQLRSFLGSFSYYRQFVPKKNCFLNILDSCLCK